MPACQFSPALPAAGSRRKRCAEIEIIEERSACPRGTSDRRPSPSPRRSLISPSSEYRHARDFDRQFLRRGAI